MNVEMLEVGWITGPAGMWRHGEPLDETIRFPIPSYVIEAGNERILVDTGLHPEAAHDAAGWYGDDAPLPFGLEQEASIAEQLDLSTITRVVMTHLHLDHAGGLSLLPPPVPIVLQRREWEAAHDRAAAVRNFYMPLDYIAVDEDRVVLVDGDHDLLGDGSIMLLSTPGHTPGHQSVQVGQSLVIGGDVTHFASGLDDHRFPMFADDFGAQTASARRLRELRDAGADVRPGHDPATLAPGRWSA